MIQKHKCQSCGTEMEIKFNETKEIYPIMCPFCGHAFEDEEISEYGEEDEDDWD
jgi:predicted RNA-binding Zn-ribbon protein involved in translation (DUF1610 family)|tara:strand:- start:52 stop:213 length:162 start_codon:yes stop_codon:yes gene_type:complete